MLARDYLRALRIRRKVAMEVDDLLSNYDAIVSPTKPLTSVPFGEEKGSDVSPAPRNTVSSLANLAGLPAISVPNGFGDHNLPTGLRFTGRAYRENTVLALARRYQSLTAWHLEHPGGGGVIRRMAMVMIFDVARWLLQIGMIRRMARVLIFDGKLYEDVREGQTATIEALVVVLLGGMSIALGLILGVASENSLEGRGIILLRSLSAAVAGWIAVSLLGTIIGRLVRRKTVLTHMLRTVGYANAPGIFSFVIVVESVNHALALMLLYPLILGWTVLAISQAISRSIDMPFSVGLWAGLVGILIMVSIRNVFTSVLL